MRCHRRLPATVPKFGGPELGTQTQRPALSASAKPPGANLCRIFEGEALLLRRMNCRFAGACCGAPPVHASSPPRSRHTTPATPLPPVKADLDLLCEDDNGDPIHLAEFQKQKFTAKNPAVALQPAAKLHPSPPSQLMLASSPQILFLDFWLSDLTINMQSLLSTARFMIFTGLFGSVGVESGMMAQLWDRRDFEGMEECCGNNWVAGFRDEILQCNFSLATKVLTEAIKSAKVKLIKCWITRWRQPRRTPPRRCR